MEVEHISAMPKAILCKAFAQAREDGITNTVHSLLGWTGHTALIALK
jgi:hypothetical protein